MIVLCPYCNVQAELSNGLEVYGRSYGNIWICRKCKAYVGTHKHDNSPLGTLANRELRQWRKLAHSVFDPLWQDKMQYNKLNKQMARQQAYRWLANQLGIAENDCHIAMFDVETCIKVVSVCMEKTDENQTLE